MVKGGGSKEKLDADSPTRKLEIIDKVITKKNGGGKGKKLEGGDVEEFSSGNSDDFAGYIFLCNGRTKPECFSYRVFGLPSFRIDIVAKIKVNTKLFLFDFDVKMLYGVYSATSTGTLNLEPRAFGGRFPAQVRFEIFKECMPLPENKFRHVIKDNYQGGSKFRQDLSADQVNGLISLFRPLPPPISASSPTSLLSIETPSRRVINQEIGRQNHPPMSLLSRESQSRRILLQEIEKQNHSPDISALSQQDLVSRYTSSRFGLSSYKSPQLQLPLYDSERTLTSADLAHEPTRIPSQLYPLSRLLLPYDNPYRSEHPRHPYFAEYSASMSHRLSSRYTNGQHLSGIGVNHLTGLPNDCDIYQNQIEATRQKRESQQIMQQSSTPPCESDKQPSSVLAAAYWVAVANEIPQPGVNQNSDSRHGTAEQNSTLLQYKPPTLASQSILDAYWEAKALEESHQARLGSSSHQFLQSSQQSMSTSQDRTFPVSYAHHDQNYSLQPNQLPVLSSHAGMHFVSHAYGDQHHQLQANELPETSSQAGTFPVINSYGDHNQYYQQHQYQLPALSSQAGVYPTSHAMTDDGNQVAATYGFGLQQQVVYDPAQIQMQHGTTPHSL